MKKTQTCIAVLRNKKEQLVFAGDRRVSAGHNYASSRMSKVAKRKGVLIGGCGLASLVFYVVHKLEIPEYPHPIDGFDYMHEYFYRALMNVFNEKGWLTGDGIIALPAGLEADFLVGYRRELFHLSLHPGIGIDIVPENVPTAIGSGGELALGSLTTTAFSRMTERSRLQLALRVAATHDSGVDTNIDIITGD